jgi:ankyrin repeat protein
MIDGLNIFMYIWFKYRFKSGMLDLYPILLDKVQDNDIIKDTIIYILFINKNISINRCRLFYDKIEPFNIIEYLPTFTSRYSHLDLITDEIIIKEIKSIISYIIHACFMIKSSIEERLKDTMEELDIFEILVKQLNPYIINQSVIKYFNEREGDNLDFFDPDYRKQMYRNHTNRPTVQIVLPIIFKILLDNGLDPNNIYNISKLTSPLINIICKYNNIELIKLFCMYDTNFYITDNSGKRAIDYMTPETLSMFQIQIERIQLPEIQPIIEINMSLFMRELVKDKLKEYLLENPEKINLKDENDRTLLYYINPDDTEIIDFLLYNGIDTNFNDEMISYIIYYILFPKRDIEHSTYKRLIEHIDFNSDTIHRIFIEEEDIDIIDYLFFSLNVF